MNRTKLKSYAPQARRDFIAAVTDRAAHYGMTKGKIEPITEQGEVSLISGTPFPRHVAAKRKRLEERINRQGFEQVMEAMAYTWFNRFVAIRYMELHGYLDHGYRVLSHPEGKMTPEIIEHAEHVDFPGLDTQKVIELKLDGTKEAELYRMLLVAQCNALHSAMPFLFERINDETELLLPDNLLHSDSLIRKLVNAIDEEDWQEVEIIGWLYQFYISEKKDEVIGKVVKSEDIPAATQLFTPNWIVKYLVQNTLGRQWMATYPDSRLKERMEFYIEPVEQTPEVQAQLREVTPDSLNPEELTLLDPACGSGHILVEAYDLLKAIYLERGYRARDIPSLILEKNLYGLEIDDRAAQLSAFALMMKAREDDRRIFSSDVKPHVLAIQASKGLDAKAVTEALNLPLGVGEKQGQQGDISQADVDHLIELFEHGKTFGSLIRVPMELAEKLPAIAQRVKEVLADGGMFEQGVVMPVRNLISQALLLSHSYNAVTTNPPYIGSRYMAPLLKSWAHEEYAGYHKDLFSAFIIRCRTAASSNGYIGVMCPFVWMFIVSYEPLRKNLVENSMLSTLVQLEYSGFSEATVPICTFCFLNTHIPQYIGEYIRLTDFRGAANQAPRTLEAIRNPDCEWRYHANADSFTAIPGTPIAYWVDPEIQKAFAVGKPLEETAKATQGIATTNNDLFLRLWHEIDNNVIDFECHSEDDTVGSETTWFPYNKGGVFRKWYGNRDYVINWKNRGEDIHRHLNLPLSYQGAPVRGKRYIFRECATWSTVSSHKFGVRYSPKGSLFDVTGSSVFTTEEMLPIIIGFLCSKVAFTMLQILNPTLHFQVGNISTLPIPPMTSEKQRNRIKQNVEEAISIAEEDWNCFEESWDFAVSPLVPRIVQHDMVHQTFEAWSLQCAERKQKLFSCEQTNNRNFITAFGLDGKISETPDDDDITLAAPDKEDDTKRLISYAVGCMMGRYSLGKPGLLYAHSGNHGFDSSQYQTFPADDDGIIPITEDDWFPDGAAHRLEAFIATAWPKEHLEENLKFVAESLGPNRNEQPRETIRRYLATCFFKHHLSMYKRRPIYWLFASGKQRAFQCLVYLHRYNEGTLSRMRTEYVIPLQGKIASRIGQLEDDITAATSTSHRKRLEKERDKLLKQQVELQTFDEKLRHYADRRIRLDLDDGVKVNYAKFGDLLAEVKAVTGSTQET